MSQLDANLSRLVRGGLYDYQVDRAAFVNFTRRYKDTRSFIHPGKLLEYFLSEQFHQYAPNQVYMDVAAQDCPFAKYVRETYGARCYRQDLYHLAPGIHDYDIGCDAASLPFPDGDVTGISLHNSIEHFEYESDCAFLREAQRLLRPGGLLLIVPLYVAELPSEQHDAGWVDERGEKHLWGVGARFSRIYSPETLMERIFTSAPALLPRIYRVVHGVEEIGTATFYLLTMEKQ